VRKYFDVTVRPSTLTERPIRLVCCQSPLQVLIPCTLAFLFDWLSDAPRFESGWHDAFGLPASLHAVCQLVCDLVCAKELGLLMTIISRFDGSRKSLLVRLLIILPVNPR